jgi:hypothetical protein
VTAAALQRCVRCSLPLVSLPPPSTSTSPGIHHERSHEDSQLPALRLGLYVPPLRSRSPPPSLPPSLARADPLLSPPSPPRSVGHLVVLLGTVYTFLGLVTFSSRNNSYYLVYMGAIASWGIVVVSPSPLPPAHGR